MYTAWQSRHFLLEFDQLFSSKSNAPPYFTANRKKTPFYEDADIGRTGDTSRSATCSSELFFRSTFSNLNMLNETLLSVGESIQMGRIKLCWFLLPDISNTKGFSAQLSCLNSSSPYFLAKKTPSQDRGHCNTAARSRQRGWCWGKPSGARDPPTSPGGLILGPTLRMRWV